MLLIVDCKWSNNFFNSWICYMKTKLNSKQNLTKRLKDVHTCSMISIRCVFQHNDFFLISNTMINIVLFKIKQIFKRRNSSVQTVVEDILRSLYHKQHDKTEDEYLLNYIATDIKLLLNIEESDFRYAVILGRSLVRPENLFEIVLSIPRITATKDGEDNIIEAIWKKLNLAQSPEILIMVSMMMK